MLEAEWLIVTGADLDVIDVPYLDLEDLSGMIREAELVGI